MIARGRVLHALACAGVLAIVVAAPAHAAARRDGARPLATTTLDDFQRLDINNLSMAVSNSGSFAYDRFIGSAGLEYPNRSGKTVVFACGLWLGAMVGGSPRVSVAEYSDDFAPGAAPNGVADDPSKAEYKVYKLSRRYMGKGGLEANVRDAALADYNAGALPHGAPLVSVLPDGTLDIPGDQMLWSVYNDLGKGAAHNRLSSALPLQVEVQQTAWAWDRTPPAGHTVFIRFRIVNRGSSPLTNLHIGCWSDPDLGNFSDDLVACDTTRGLAYCYNATNNDALYGASPPAVGIDMLQGPYSVTLGQMLQPTAFLGYVNGAGPQDSLQTFRNLSGLQENGTVILDPSLQPTPFMYAGDPVAAQGWLDASPSDRRFLLAAGPVTIAPGDAQEVVFAVIVGQGPNRLASVSALRAGSSWVQDAFDHGDPNLTGVSGAPPARLALAPPRPNPGRGAVTLALTLPADGEATLELVDLAGRCVERRSLGRLPAGPHAIPLDLARAQLAPGLYFARVTQRGASASQRLVVLD